MPGATSAAVGPARLSGLRLLALCDYFSPSSCGGAERVALEVYRRLAQWGAEVTVVTAVPGEAERSYEVSGVRVLSVPAIDLSRVVQAQVALSPRLMRRVFRVAEDLRPHVVHANALHFQTSLGAAVVSRRKRLPLVTTAHIAGLDFLPPVLRLTTAAYERTAGRFVLSSSQRAIAVSEPVARHLAVLGMPHARIDVVANGVDHDVFFPMDRPASPVPLVMFVGRLIPNKGAHLLIEALARLREQGVAVRGEFLGDGPQRASLQRTARERGISDDVRFVGQVANIGERLRRADVLVRPSSTEGMPLAVLEAMATRLCVVASAVPGNAALIRDGENGRLFSPNNQEDLVSVLRWVLGNAEERERLALAGYRCAEGHSWDATAAGTARVLCAASGHRGMEMR